MQVLQLHYVNLHSHFPTLLPLLSNDFRPMSKKELNHPYSGLPYCLYPTMFIFSNFLIIFSPSFFKNEKIYIWIVMYLIFHSLKTSLLVKIVNQNMFNIIAPH